MMPLDTLCGADQEESLFVPVRKLLSNAAGEGSPASNASLTSTVTFYSYSEKTTLSNTDRK